VADRIRGVYGTPWSKLAKGIPITRKILNKLGECLVEAIASEAKKDFAKRGWSGKDPMDGPPIWDSFSFNIRGKSTVEVLSSFWGIDEMLEPEGIPSRRMSWLSQQKKDSSPAQYKLTKAEKKSRMKKGGRLSKGQRRPLVVPIKTKAGTVLFRTATFNFGNAWVHPGIARFNFVERGIKKGRQYCADILGEEVLRQLAEGDPLR